MEDRRGRGEGEGVDADSLVVSIPNERAGGTSTGSEEGELVKSWVDMGWDVYDMILYSDPMKFMHRELWRLSADKDQARETTWGLCVVYITTNVRKRWVNLSDPLAGNETGAERRHHKARRWSFLAPISQYEQTGLALRQARQCSFLIKSFTESTPSRHQCFQGPSSYLPFSTHLQHNLTHTSNTLSSTIPQPSQVHHK